MQPNEHASASASEPELGFTRLLSSTLQSADKTISESLVLDDSEKGVIIKGITDDTIAAKSGLQAGNSRNSLCFPLDGWDELTSCCCRRFVFQGMRSLLPPFTWTTSTKTMC